VFALLQACLGLQIDARRGEVALHAPRLPDFIDSMEIRHVGAGPHTADLRLQRYGKHVGVDVTRRLGALKVRLRL
jgi:hypothetical protein